MKRVQQKVRFDKFLSKFALLKNMKKKVLKNIFKKYIKLNIVMIKKECN